jgi:hypothetical protein
LKSNNEIEELKTSVDDFINFYARNIKYKLGEPNVRNNGVYSDLIIRLDH